MISLGFNVTEIKLLIGGDQQRFDILLTEGLRRIAQDEIAFSFRAGQVDLPKTAGILREALMVLAQQIQAGRPASPYGFTAFGPNSPALIPDSDFRGLLYLPGGVPGLAQPGYLPALALPADDAVLAHDTSFLRVASRLGQLESYFPFPFWTDPRRPPVAGEGDETSILRRVPRVALPGFNVTKTANGFRVVVSKAAAKGLKEGIRAHSILRSPTPLALVSSFDPGWKAIMVWEPGQAEATAICDGPDPPGDEFGLHFIALVPEQTVSTGRLIEDGVGLTLRNDDWKLFMGAVVKRKGAVRLDDGTDIRVARG